MVQFSEGAATLFAKYNELKVMQILQVSATTECIFSYFGSYPNSNTLTTKQEVNGTYTTYPQRNTLMDFLTVKTALII
jgi:hypothetical protein